MNTGYITIQKIIEDISYHPLLRDIPIDRVVNYTLELMRIIGCPKLFEDKFATIEIKDYRGLLPCDFVFIKQVMGECNQEFVGATDNFLGTHEVKGTLSYKIQGNVIITSLNKGFVDIAYRAIATDENGFPMIPDNAEFIRALESYIKVERFKILFDMGEINANAFQVAQQDYCFNIAQAINNFNIPTEDEMETLTNIWHNLIPRMREHSNGFATMHNKEYLKRH